MYPPCHSPSTYGQSNAPSPLRRQGEGVVASVELASATTARRKIATAASTPRVIASTAATIFGKAASSLAAWSAVTSAAAGTTAAATIASTTIGAKARSTLLDHDFLPFDFVWVSCDCRVVAGRRGELHERALLKRVRRVSDGRGGHSHLLSTDVEISQLTVLVQRRPQLVAGNLVRNVLDIGQDVVLVSVTR